MSSPALKTWSETLIVTTPPIPELGYRDIVITFQNKFNFLFTCTHQAVWAVVVFQYDEPVTHPHRKRYTDADAEALAKRVLDKPVTDQLVFADIWKRRREPPRVVMLQEGVLENWHHGRICLVGDAAHKVRRTFLLPIDTSSCLSKLINSYRPILTSPLVATRASKMSRN